MHAGVVMILRDKKIIIQRRRTVDEKSSPSPREWHKITKILKKSAPHYICYTYKVTVSRNFEHLFLPVPADAKSAKYRDFM